MLSSLFNVFLLLGIVTVYGDDDNSLSACYFETTPQGCVGGGSSGDCIWFYYTVSAGLCGTCFPYVDAQVSSCEQLQTAYQSYPPVASSYCKGDSLGGISGDQSCGVVGEDCYAAFSLYDCIESGNSWNQYCYWKQDESSSNCGECGPWLTWESAEQHGSCSSAISGSNIYCYGDNTNGVEQNTNNCGTGDGDNDSNSPGARCDSESNVSPCLTKDDYCFWYVNDNADFCGQCGTWVDSLFSNVNDTCSNNLPNVPGYTYYCPGDSTAGLTDLTCDNAGFTCYSEPGLTSCLNNPYCAFVYDTNNPTCGSCQGWVSGDTLQYGTDCNSLITFAKNVGWFEAGYDAICPGGDTNGVPTSICIGDDDDNSGDDDNNGDDDSDSGSSCSSKCQDVQDTCLASLNATQIVSYPYTKCDFYVYSCVQAATGLEDPNFDDSNEVPPSLIYSCFREAFDDPSVDCSCSLEIFECEVDDCEWGARGLNCTHCAPDYVNCIVLDEECSNGWETITESLSFGENGEVFVPSLVEQAITDICANNGNVTCSQLLLDTLDCYLDCNFLGDCVWQYCTDSLEACYYDINCLPDLSWVFAIDSTYGNVSDSFRFEFIDYYCIWMRGTPGVNDCTSDFNDAVSCYINNCGEGDDCFASNCASESSPCFADEDCGAAVLAINAYETLCGLRDYSSNSDDVYYEPNDYYNTSLCYDLVPLSRKGYSVVQQLCWSDDYTCGDEFLDAFTCYFKECDTGDDTHNNYYGADDDCDIVAECLEEVVACYFDQDCYEAFWINWVWITARLDTARHKRELNNVIFYTPSEAREEIESFCNNVTIVQNLGIDCNDNFWSLWDCYAEECLFDECQWIHCTDEIEACQDDQDCEIDMAYLITQQVDGQELVDAATSYCNGAGTCNSIFDAAWNCYIDNCFVVTTAAPGDDDDDDDDDTTPDDDDDTTPDDDDDTTPDDDDDTTPGDDDDDTTPGDDDDDDVTPDDDDTGDDDDIQTGSTTPAPTTSACGTDVTQSCLYYDGEVTVTSTQFDLCTFDWYNVIDIVLENSATICVRVICDNEINNPDTLTFGVDIGINTANAYTKIVNKVTNFADRLQTECKNQNPNITTVTITTDPSSFTNGASIEDCTGIGGGSGANTLAITVATIVIFVAAIIALFN